MTWTRLRTLYLVFFLALVSILTYAFWSQNFISLNQISWKIYQNTQASTVGAVPSNSSSAASSHSSSVSGHSSSVPSHSSSVSIHSISTAVSATSHSTPISTPSPSEAPALPTPSPSPLPTLSKDRPSKITIIAIWIPRNGDLNYLPYFFQSVESNPQINLLFVNVVDHQNGCKIHSNATNIQELCLNEEDYYNLHVAFLCKEWRCSDVERQGLFEHIFRQRKIDYNYSFFRILRSGIFEKWIDPATTMWGWCDLDTFWGNFDRAFPWDIAPNYDIIAITSQPDFADQRLLFTRGHMAFFRHTPETLRKLHAYHPFTSLEAYVQASPLREDAEESQFSHYYFAVSDAFTFLHVEGMIDSQVTILISEKGTFYLEPHKAEFDLLETRQRVLAIVAEAHSQSKLPPDGSSPNNQTYLFPSFTPTGRQKPSPVKTEGFLNWVWFPKEYIAYYEPGWVVGEREHKAYFMRDVEHGPTEQRLESRDRYLLDRDGLNIGEGLYKHFQAEKYRAWFRRYPATKLPPGHTMVHFRGDQGEIWDEAGNVVFETGRDEPEDI